MDLDPKVREELAERRYLQADRSGIRWIDRPEWLKQAFREAVEKELAPFASTHPFDLEAAGLRPVPGRRHEE